MRITIAAGGTGGHVFPAVAVATRLVERGDAVQWIGRPSSLEESEAKVLGAVFSAIPLQGLKRKWSWDNVNAVFRFLKGRRLARKALTGFRPEVVFALGSYVGAPVVSAALSLHVPVLVHEQNVVPGLVVRRYAPKVSRLLLTKPLVSSDLRARTAVVGMPLRPDILRERTQQTYLDLGLDPGKKTLFIFGGSQGAKAFCEVGSELARKWQTDRPDWQILLQTGVANLEWIRSRVTERNVTMVGHLREMGKAYACADAIVSRSGAASCAELEAVGKPVVLVPYPHATADHQRLNAESFAQNPNAVVIPQQELTVGRLESAVREVEGYPARPMTEAEILKPVRTIVGILDEVARGGEGRGIDGE